MFDQLPFTGSSLTNQSLLMEAFRSSFFSDIPFVGVSTSKYWGVGDRIDTECSILHPENVQTKEQAAKFDESALIVLAFSALVFQEMAKWRSCENDRFRPKNSWVITVSGKGVSFLKQFFAEKWDDLSQNHPLVKQVLSASEFEIWNAFDDKEERSRLITWVRLVLESIGHYPGGFENEEIRWAWKIALQHVVSLLGDGHISLDNYGWVYDAVAILEGTDIVSEESITVMKSYSPGNHFIGKGGRSEQSIYQNLGFDQFPSKYSNWSESDLRERGLRIGIGAYVHPGAYIGRNVRIGQNAVISIGAKIEDGASIGALSYIGPGVQVRQGEKIKATQSLIGFCFE